MKTTVALLVLFFSILIGGYILSNSGKSDDAVTAAPAPAASTTELASAGAAASSGTTPAANSYTSAQVASHNTSTSCWTSINSNVYDLTAWISQHPGGEAAILSICGKDGTQAFEAQHGNDRNPEPQQMLATFKIGTLAS